MPVKARPVALMRDRYEIIDQGLADAGATIGGIDKEVFEVATWAKTPRRRMGYRERKANQSTIVRKGAAPDDEAFRIDHVGPCRGRYALGNFSLI